ncbi:MAG: transcription termination factor Rho, partial [Rubrobacter sp.]|nr:transcription termination factor Rho [Rubrobacter sp.]
MTELGTLENKRLSDLHQIASQLGIPKYRTYRKPELAQRIYQVATEQAGTNAAVEETSPLTEITPAESSPVEAAPSEIPAEPLAEHPAEAPAAPSVDGESSGQENSGQENSGQQGKQKSRQQDNGQHNGKAKGKDRQQEGGGQDGSQDGQEDRQSGILDVLPDGFGFLRTSGYSQSSKDVYVSTSQIKRFNLRRGDRVVGQIRQAREGEKYPAMVRIESINGKEPQKGRKRQSFDDLTPLYPDDRLRLEWKPNDLAPRVIDLVAPIGKGQRGLIVSPPKAGKTTILKQIAQSIVANYPETKLMVLLADERPEEVTDWERSVAEAEVVSSTFDQPADNHIAVAELLLERVKRMVEDGDDVVVLLDSITRLARAYNLGAPASGRILSGGVDSAAL